MCTKGQTLNPDSSLVLNANNADQTVDTSTYGHLVCTNDLETKAKKENLKQGKVKQRHKKAKASEKLCHKNLHSHSDCSPMILCQNRSLSFSLYTVILRVNFLHGLSWRRHKSSMKCFISCLR